MKANELQLGNIVAVYPSMMPITIAAIHKGKVGYHYVSNKLEWVRIGLIRPIPLMAEILEKNGYKYEKQSICIADDLYTNIDFFEYKIEEECTIVIDNWKLSIDTPIGGISNIEVSYIHELQHAIKLCGLNDLADNFKI